MKRRVARAPKREAWRAGAAERERWSFPPDYPQNVNQQRSKPATIALRRGKHSEQEIDRQRVANRRNAKTARRNKIARESRRGNR